MTVRLATEPLPANPFPPPAESSALAVDHEAVDPVPALLDANLNLALGHDGKEDHLQVGVVTSRQAVNADFLGTGLGGPATSEANERDSCS